MTNGAHGYDAIADDFARERGRSRIGATHVREWAAALVDDCEVLDVACGMGYPITHALLDAGCGVWAVDASPRMVDLFTARFPAVPVLCEDVGSMTHFSRQFGGIVAWGLLFLLPPDDQPAALAKLADAVRPGGQLLVTAPADVAQWIDVMTGRASFGLGLDAYRSFLERAGLTLVRTFADEGENHYYQAQRA